MNRQLIRRMPLPLRAAVQLVWPTGQHRATPARAGFPPAPYAAIAVQAFRHCPPCGVETAAVLHAGGAHTCTEGHLVLPGHTTTTTTGDQ